MVLSSSGGGSRINRARVTYGGRGRAGGLLHLKKPPTTSSLTSLPDESDDDDDSSSESSSSSEDDERKVGKMLVEKKEKVKATRGAAPWGKKPVAKKEPLRQHAANMAHAAPTKRTPLKVSVPAPHPASSSSLSSAPSSSAASSASTSSRKASLAAQRKVQRILSFEEEEKKKADDQEKQTRRPSRTETAARDAAEDVAEKLEQQLRLSEDDGAPKSADELASLLAACSQRQSLAFDDALQSILGGPTTSHLLRVEKAGDASYSKVYRLTKRVTREDIDWEESSILKVIPLRDGSDKETEGTSETSSCADVEREIAITRALCSVKSSDEKRSQGRFVELRGAYVAEGPLPAVLCNIDDGDNDDSGHASDHQRKAGKKGRRARASSPRSSSSPTLYALLDLDDCGVDLESYALPSSSSSSSSSATLVALSILTQVIDSLAVAEERFEFEHRDLHWGNVLVRDVSRSSASPSSSCLNWASLIDSHHTGVEATIIDFTLSRLTESGGAAPRYYDLAVDPSLFEGDGEVDEQFDVYRGVRDVVEQGEGGQGRDGGWARFEPRTNVLWARYLVRKLLDGKELRGCGEGEGDDALQLLEAVEAVLSESVEHFYASTKGSRSSERQEGRIESMVQLRDWMKEEMERRVRQKEEEQARRPRARQQSQRPRKAAATKEDGPTRRRSVRR